MTAYIGTAPYYFPQYAFAKTNAMAIAGLDKSYKRLAKLNKIKKESKRTFILTCPECETMFEINDLDIEIICPICNEIEE